MGLSWGEKSQGVLTPPPTNTIKEYFTPILLGLRWKLGHLVNKVISKSNFAFLCANFVCAAGGAK